MGSISKTLALTLTLIIAMSFLTILLVKPANAQIGITTPTMPSFSVGYDEDKNYISPSYSVDPSTGKAIMTHEGYYKVSRETYVSIANQPFEPYTDSEGNYIQLFYDVRWKVNGNQSWQGLGVYRFTQVSDFSVTRILIGFKGYDGAMGVRLLDYIPGAQIDFQVQALIGYYTANNAFVGQSSGWSNTETLTLTASVSSPTSTPAVPELSWLAMVPLLVSVLAIAVLARGKSRNFD